MLCSSCSSFVLTLVIAILLLLFSIALLNYSWQNGDNQKTKASLKDLPLLKQLLKAPKSADDKTVEDCFYDHSWLVYDKKENRHPCFVIAESDNDRPLSARERRLRAMFQQLLRRDREDRKLVDDCFSRHRFDNHPPCWGISWGGGDLLGNQSRAGQLRERRIRQLWLDLVVKDFKREMRCRFHPWMVFNDC